MEKEQYKLKPNECCERYCYLIDYEHCARYILRHNLGKIPIKYRIWSVEHNSWRKGNKQGYTKDVTSARIYSVYEANAICTDSNKGISAEMSHLPVEAMVPVEED